MALLFLGKTECPLCGEVIWDGAAAVSFPHFTANTKDPLYKFTDSSFHSKCFEMDVLADKAIKFSQEFILKTRFQNRICVVSGNQIKSGEDCVFIGLLTSDENEELFHFNFTNINRNNIPAWEKKNRFIYLFEKFIAEGKWEEINSSKYFETFIKENIRL